MSTHVAERVRAFASPALIAVTAAALALRTRPVWGDPVVDFGRELYLAWRLSEGAVLYRDVAHFNGPLASYVNAAWFNVMGPGLAQLTALNLLVLAAVTTALFLICRSIGGRTGATVAPIVFLALQGLGYFGGGTYNFVTPYSHELTHGVLWGLLAVAAAGAYARTGATRWATAAGMCAGFAFLTKPETFLATAIAVGVGLGAAAWFRARDAEAADFHRSRSLTIPFAAACGAAVLPPLVAFVALAGPLGHAAAADGLLHQWSMAADPRITRLPYYRWVSGLDAIGTNVLALLAWTTGVVAVLFALAWGCSRVRAGHRARAITFGAVSLTVLALGVWVPWHRIWFVLPAGVAAVLIDTGLRIARREGDSVREVTTMAFGTLALLLLAKQGLYPRVTHYGFALAAPAVALCVVGLVARIPGRLPRGGGTFRSAALGLVTGVTLFHVGLSQAAIAEVTSVGARVGVGREALLTDPTRALVLQEVIDRVGTEPAEATLAVLPEGAYLNFALRRPNSTAFIQLLPPELITWGEDAVLDAYQRAPPDVVVLVHRDWSEYGTGTFGSTHGRELMAWLRDRYRSVQLVGGRPFTEAGTFGAEILTLEAGVPTGVAATGSSRWPALQR